jgi:hypothetical protein
VKSVAVSLMMGTETAPETSITINQLLMMKTENVLETSIVFNRLTRQIAREDFVDLAAVKAPSLIKAAVLPGKRCLLCFRADSGIRNSEPNKENGVFSAVCV